MTNRYTKWTWIGPWKKYFMHKEPKKYECIEDDEWFEFYIGDKEFLVDDYDNMIFFGKDSEKKWKFENFDDDNHKLYKKLRKLHNLKDR